MTPPACIFCEIVAKRAHAALVHEDDDVLAFLDIHPVREGHTLVIPRRHVTHLEDLSELEYGRITTIARRVLLALGALGLCPASNFLINNGRAAGQTVPHVHLHVIPRSPRDLGEVKFLARLLHLFGRREPEGALDDLAARIRAALAPARDSG